MYCRKVSKARTRIRPDFRRYDSIDLALLVEYRYIEVKGRAGLVLGLRAMSIRLLNV